MTYILLVTKYLKVTEARRQLFELFEEVTSNTRARVIIGHRDVEGEAMLVSRKEIERLEQRARAAGSAFSIAGTASLNVAPEAVLHEVRREQRRRAREKWGDAATDEPVRAPDGRRGSG